MSGNKWKATKNIITTFFLWKANLPLSVSNDDDTILCIFKKKTKISEIMRRFKLEWNEDGI